MSDIERDRIVMIEWGAYSDRVVLGYFKVLKPFDPYIELASHVERQVAIGGCKLVSNYEFVSELEASGYIEFIPCDRLYISAYCEPGTMEYSKNHCRKDDLY